MRTRGLWKTHAAPDDDDDEDEQNSLVDSPSVRGLVWCQIRKMVPRRSQRPGPWQHLYQLGTAMVDFTVPTCTQSTGNAAGFETFSDILADHTAPTGGTLQHPHSTTSLALEEFTTVAIPWIFVNYSLPLRATSATMWERTDGDITVILAATPYEDADGTTQYHLPSGRIAREVLMYLVTSAMTSGSPTIEISRTWRGFLRDMGVPYSSANRRAVERQLRAILNMSIRVSHRTANASGTNLSSRACLVGSGEDLVFDRDGALDDAYRSVVILSDEFFDRIAAAPSPVHGTMRVLRDSWRQIVTENPHQALAGDVYLWLAGRMSRVRREVRIPWADLAAQFGSTMSAERRWRQQFRSALSVATKTYFAPLGEDFDSTVYINEYDLGSRTRPGGLRLAPVSAEHRKVLGWGSRRSTTKPAQAPAKKHTPTNHQNPNLTETSASITPQTTHPEIVTIPTHEGVDIGELRTHLDHNGVNTTAVSDGALRAAIDRVLSRVGSVSNAQALVTTAIVREPALLGITAPAQKVVALSLPIGKCRIHNMDITGKVCGGCAAELKATSTSAAEAQACWETVETRLKSLTNAGFGIADEMARYRGLAIARGVTLSI